MQKINNMFQGLGYAASYDNFWREKHCKIASSNDIAAFMYLEGIAACMINVDFILWFLTTKMTMAMTMTMTTWRIEKLQDEAWRDSSPQGRPR